MMRWLAYISFSLYFNNGMCHIGELLLNIIWNPISFSFFVKTVGYFLSERSY